MNNLCLQYLKNRNKNIDEYWMKCDKLAIEVIKHFVNKDLKILHISLPGSFYLEPSLCYVRGDLIKVAWAYHVVVEENGYIHDAWLPYVFKMRKYLRKNFGHHKNLKWY